MNLLLYKVYVYISHFQYMFNTLFCFQAAGFTGDLVKSMICNVHVVFDF